MTTENNAAANAAANDEDSNEDSKGVQPQGEVDKGDYKLKLLKIDNGVNKGALFWVKVYKTLEGSVRHFTELSKNAKTGDAVVLGLLNAALAFRLRGKAVSRITWSSPKDATVADKNKFMEEVKKKLATGENIISSDEAAEYIPGEREVDALSGLLRQKIELFKAIKEAKAKGDKETIKVQVVKYQEVCRLIQEKQDAEQAEILAALE